MTKYYWRFPGMVYAHIMWADNKRLVKQLIRDWLGINKLPNHTEIWR